MAYCDKCGHEHSVGARFCEACGREFAEAGHNEQPDKTLRTVTADAAGADDDSIPERKARRRAIVGLVAFTLVALVGLVAGIPFVIQSIENRDKGTPRLLEEATLATPDHVNGDLICLGPGTDVFVCDTGGGKITRLNEDGEKVASWQFLRPKGESVSLRVMGMAWAADGLFVCGVRGDDKKDEAWNAILWETEGDHNDVEPSVYAEIPANLSEVNRDLVPAVWGRLKPDHESGRLLAVDRINSRLVRLEGFSTVASLDSVSPRDDMEFLRDVCVGDGKIFVLWTSRAAGGDDHVAVYDDLGNELADFPAMRPNDGTHRSAHSIAFDEANGRLLVGEWGGDPGDGMLKGRVQVFSPDGEFVETWAGMGNPMSNIAVDGEGNAYVAGSAGFVHRFPADEGPEW